jgi:uncharacterized protein
MREINNAVIHEMKTHQEIREILEHPEFLAMKNFRHHGNVSCLEHTMTVARIAYATAKKMKADHITATRAALLHDFYLYDWHTDSPGLHGFKHPKLSLKNAERYFSLNPIEREAIIRHMWPLTPVPPRHRESLIVTYADKRAAIGDYIKVFRRLLKLNFVKNGLEHVPIIHSPRQ